MASPQAEHGHTDIAHDYLERLIGADLTSREYKLMLSIIRKTWGWKKKTDWIRLAEFSTLTGISKVHCCKLLKKLYLRKFVAKHGNGNNIRYGIQKDYDKWLPSQAIAHRGKGGLPKKATPLLLDKRNIIKENILQDDGLDSHSEPPEKKHVKPRQPSWLTGFAQVWEHYLGGAFPYARAGKVLKLLIHTHEESAVLKKWQTYLAFMKAKDQLQYVSVHHFSGKYGLWRVGMQFNKSTKGWESADRTAGIKVMDSVLKARKLKHQAEDEKNRAKSEWKVKQKLLLQSQQILGQGG